MKKEKIPVLDLTPTWESLVDIMMMKLEEKETGHEARETIKEEFKRMARAADKWNAYVKEQKNKD